MIASTGRGPADDASFALSFRTLSVSSCGGDEVQPKKVRRETKELVGEILGENPKKDMLHTLTSAAVYSLSLGRGFEGPCLCHA